MEANPVVLRIIAGARVAGKHYGIPWRLLAGVALHESGHGRALSAPNNVIGMKWAAGQWKLPGARVQTKENVGGAELSVAARFASFPSVEACMVYLAELLTFSSHYGGVRRCLAAGDLVAAANTMGGIYATDPHWARGVLGNIAMLEADGA